MPEKAIGVPTVKGMGSAFKDFAWGAAGGLLFLLLYRLFGALGVIAAPIIVGATMKGERGSTITTMAGFMLLALGVLGGLGSSGNGNSNTSTEVM